MAINVDKKSAQGPATAAPQNPIRASAVSTDGPPPAYLSSVSANRRGKHSSSSQIPPVSPKMTLPTPTGVKPTNHLSIIRKQDALNETICIDPAMVLPTTILPPLQPEQLERENLRVQSSHGSVSLDIWVVSDDENYRLNPNRTVLLIKADHGEVNATLHTPGSPRPPVHFTITSDNGDVQVRLPSSFTGPIFLTMGRGSVKFSNAIQAQLTPLGDVKQERRYFIGDLSAWSDLNGNWNGDELVVKVTTGTLKVQYEGDAGESCTIA